MAGGLERGLGRSGRRRHRAGRDRLRRRRLDPHPRLRLRRGGAEADPRPCRVGLRRRAAARLGGALPARPDAARHRRLSGRAGRAGGGRCRNPCRRRNGRWLSEVGADTGRLRVAFCTEPWSGADVVAEVRAACEADGGAPGRARARGDRRHSPQFCWEQFLDAMTVIWSATTAQTVDGFAQAVGRDAMPQTRSSCPPCAWSSTGARCPSRSCCTRSTSPGTSAARWRRSSPDFDLLLTPTLGALPARLGVYQPDVRARAAGAVQLMVTARVVPAGLQCHRPARHQPAAPPEQRRPADRHAAGRPLRRRGHAAARRRTARAGVALGRPRATAARRRRAVDATPERSPSRVPTTTSMPQNGQLPRPASGRPSPFPGLRSSCCTHDLRAG